jgi:hypothetical protein
MKLTKEKLTEFIRTARELRAALSFHYIPKEDLEQPSAFYSLYYGGAPEITISRTHFRDTRYVDIMEITDENFNEIVEIVFNTLNNNIQDELHRAMKNLNWEYEEFKYFDRNPEKFETFKAEITKLLNQGL